MKFTDKWFFPIDLETTKNKSYFNYLQSIGLKVIVHDSIDDAYYINPYDVMCNHRISLISAPIRDLINCRYKPISIEKAFDLIADRMIEIKSNMKVDAKLQGIDVSEFVHVEKLNDKNMKNNIYTRGSVLLTQFLKEYGQQINTGFDGNKDDAGYHVDDNGRLCCDRITLLNKTKTEVSFDIFSDYLIKYFQLKRKNQIVKKIKTDTKEHPKWFVVGCSELENCIKWLRKNYNFNTVAEGCSGYNAYFLNEDKESFKKDMLSIDLIYNMKDYKEISVMEFKKIMITYMQTMDIERAKEIDAAEKDKKIIEKAKVILDKTNASFESIITPKKINNIFNF